MRRNKAFKRGRLVPVLLAGLVGYLVGAWHPATQDPAIKDGEQTAAAMVALRFPQAWNAPSPSFAAADASTAAAAMVTAGAIKHAELALFRPEPMIAPANIEPARNADLAMGAQAAATAAVNPSPAPDTGGPMPAPRPSAAARPATAAAATAMVARHATANRPGYVLDDAQIASIKERLHMTADQEQMWPAVEVALRNIAYLRMQAARRSGASDGAADPDPDAVASLKSAAVPLIMSFDDDQKQEVRNIAHVMGLDRLASQF